MDTMSRVASSPRREDGVLPALLFDPKYRPSLDDVRVVAHNLRDVSDRLAGGRGTLGSLVKDEPARRQLRQASQDLQAAMANLGDHREDQRRARARWARSSPTRRCTSGS